MTIGELNTDAKVRLNLDDLKSYATYWIRSFRVNWYGWGTTPHEVHLQYTDATRADIITSLASMEAQEVVRWQKELDKIKVLKLIVDNALAEAVVAVGINYFQIKEATLKRHNAAFLTELTEQGWQNQLTVVTSFLTIANNKRENATFAMNNNSLYSKLALIEASKYANTALFTEIQTLEAYKRTDTDSATVDNFNQQYQTLHTATNTLMASYEEKKRIEDEAAVIKEAALTGHWKFPIIKGLTYATATYSGVTDESGAFKCQLGEIVDFSIESLALTSVPCTEILGIKSTNSVAIANTSGGNFKDWQNEPDKQMAITKVLFGLFGESIKNAFNQEDESLKIITVDLTDEQKANTVGESLEVNDLSLLVQSILGTTEAAVLPTTEQVDNMIVSGWQVSKVFDTDTDNGGNNDTGNVSDTSASKKSSGGGCVCNPNAKGRADIGFILLMVLSVYYFIKRKRLATI
ncbi:hypothetical protein [uncultured Gammaproteobacteria bacterium]|jgi:hypothetical protein|nr:hypothetical protein [uncultured Gammaproteobacteria bacterium]CAC9539477.1 hypothetical protein [uncultured Gammaproteobacteria bacterium]CAC9550522.1 hypothetical protein [uncultured Gammaproteobacteria bacterium]